METKMLIAQVVEELLLSLKHPEMPTERVTFTLHVEGKESWSWADILPNWAFDGRLPKINPWNEKMAEIIKNRKETNESR